MNQESPALAARIHDGDDTARNNRESATRIAMARHRRDCLMAAERRGVKFADLEIQEIRP